MRGAGDVQGFQTIIPPDTVIHVDHQIAGRNLGDVRDKIFCAATFFLRTDNPLAQDVLFRDQENIVADKAVLDG